MERLVQYALLARMHQPIGSLLLLWPTLWALWIAGAGEPDPAVVIVFVAGVFVMRSAGCVMNDFADRRIDPHVRRTMHRPIASGKVAPREALGVFAALCLVALGLVLTLNRLAVMYSFAALALAASYPFMKRWTYLPQVHLGIAFGWGIPMAFAALTDAVPALAWLLLTGVVAWAVAYDTMYAMVDREDDLRVGVKSSAILFGDADRFFVGASQVAVLAVLVLAGRQAGLGVFFDAATALSALLFLYQQYLIRDREPAACFRAFLNNNWVGSACVRGDRGGLRLGLSGSRGPAPRSDGMPAHRPRSSTDRHSSCSRPRVRPSGPFSANSRPERRVAMHGPPGGMTRLEPDGVRPSRNCAHPVGAIVCKTSADAACTPVRAIFARRFPANDKGVVS